MDTITPFSSRTEYDPALLAFLKCHVTSFVRWDLFRLLADADGRWFDPDDLSRRLQKPRSVVETALIELADEDLVDRRTLPSGPVYRLDPAGPTARVVDRLVTAARRSQEFRQLIVARVVAQARVAS